MYKFRSANETLLLSHIFISRNPCHPCEEPILSNADIESTPPPSKDDGGTDVLTNIE